MLSSVFTFRNRTTTMISCRNVLAPSCIFVVDPILLIYFLSSQRNTRNIWIEVLSPIWKRLQKTVCENDKSDWVTASLNNSNSLYYCLLNYGTVKEDMSLNKSFGTWYVFCREPRSRGRTRITLRMWRFKSARIIKRGCQLCDFWTVDPLCCRISVHLGNDPHPTKDKENHVAMKHINSFLRKIMDGEIHDTFK